MARQTSLRSIQQQLGFVIVLHFLSCSLSLTLSLSPSVTWAELIMGSCLWSMHLWESEHLCLISLPPFKGNKRGYSSLNRCLSCVSVAPALRLLVALFDLAFISIHLLFVHRHP